MLTRLRLRLRALKTRPIWTAGKSTEWPGCTRFAVWAAGFSSLLALAELGIGAVVTNRLIKYGKIELLCYQMGTGPLEWAYQRPPLTIIDRDGSMQNFSISERHSNFSVVMYAIISPLSTLFFSASIVFAHRCSKGISTRMGVLLSLWMVFEWLSYLFDFSSLSVDRYKVEKEWDECWVEHDAAVTMWSERKERMALVWARAWIVVVGTVVMSIYFALALRAFALAWQSHRNSPISDPEPRARILGQARSNSDQDVELQTLPAAPELAHHNDRRFRCLSVDLDHLHAVSAPLPDERRSEEQSDEESDLGLVGRSEGVDGYDFGIAENPFADPVSPFETSRGPFVIGDAESSEWEGGWNNV